MFKIKIEITFPNVSRRKPLSEKAKLYFRKSVMKYAKDLCKRAEDQASAEGVDVVSKSHVIKAQQSLLCHSKKSRDNIKFLAGSLFGVFAAIIVNDCIIGNILGTTHLIIILLMIICVLVYSSFIR